MGQIGQTIGNRTVEKVARDGFAMVPGLVDHDCIAELRHVIDRTPDNSRFSTSQKSVLAVLQSSALTDWVRALCGHRAHIVRLLIFAKSRTQNWFVPWHQDRTVAIRQRKETDGFGRWTVKKGIDHSEAPRDLLDRMVTLRIHLDDTPKDSGPVEVLPGTHKYGRLTQKDIAELTEQRPATICAAKSGDALIMKPLLVHRSRRTRSPTRRIVHLEVSPDLLRPPLQWHAAYPLNRNTEDKPAWIT